MEEREREAINSGQYCETTKHKSIKVVGWLFCVFKTTSVLQTKLIKLRKNELFKENSP